MEAAGFSTARSSRLLSSDDTPSSLLRACFNGAEKKLMLPPIEHVLTSANVPLLDDLPEFSERRFSLVRLVIWRIVTLQERSKDGGEHHYAIRRYLDAHLPLMLLIGVTRTNAPIRKEREASDNRRRKELADKCRAKMHTLADATAHHNKAEIAYNNAANISEKQKQTQKKKTHTITDPATLAQMAEDLNEAEQQLQAALGALQLVQQEIKVLEAEIAKAYQHFRCVGIGSIQGDEIPRDVDTASMLAWPRWREFRPVDAPIHYGALPDMTLRLIDLSYWSELKSPSNQTDPFKHIFSKALPRACGARGLATVLNKCKDADVMHVVQQAWWCSLLGNYPWARSRVNILERLTIYARPTKTHFSSDDERLMFHVLKEFLVAQMPHDPALHSYLCENLQWHGCDVNTRATMDAYRNARTIAEAARTMKDGRSSLLKFRYRPILKDSARLILGLLIAIENNSTRRRLNEAQQALGSTKKRTKVPAATLVRIWRLATQIDTANPQYEEILGAVGAFGDGDATVVRAALEQYARAETDGTVQHCLSDLTIGCHAALRALCRVIVRVGAFRVHTLPKHWRDLQMRGLRATHGIADGKPVPAFAQTIMYCADCDVIKSYVVDPEWVAKRRVDGKSVRGTNAVNGIGCSGVVVVMCPKCWGSGCDACDHRGHSLRCKHQRDRNAAYRSELSEARSVPETRRREPCNTVARPAEYFECDLCQKCGHCVRCDPKSCEKCEYRRACAPVPCETCETCERCIRCEGGGCPECQDKLAWPCDKVRSNPEFLECDNCRKCGACIACDTKKENKSCDECLPRRATHPEPPAFDLIEDAPLVALPIVGNAIEHNGTTYVMCCNPEGCGAITIYRARTYEGSYYVCGACEERRNVTHVKAKNINNEIKHVCMVCETPIHNTAYPHQYRIDDEVRTGYTCRQHKRPGLTKLPFVPTKALVMTSCRDRIANMRGIDALARHYMHKRQKRPKRRRGATLA
jgi:hypothetical protein